ncbi:trypsin-like serine protease [Rhodospirillales bacterium]|nr:trypsin-like serine protease [Rhodospirillales bacterium]
MMRACLIAFGMIGLLIAPMSVNAQATDYKYKPRSVFGAGDKRVKADSQVYPCTAIGRFNRAGRGHCSASVVAPRIVVTSAHCLVHKASGTFMAPDKLHFVAGADRGEYIFHSIAAEIHPAPKFDPIARPTLKTIVHDWALIVLEEDPSPTTGILKPAPYNDDVFWKLREKNTVFTQAGYSGDRGQVLTAHPKCLMLGFRKAPKVLEHGCQTVPGDSGSPIVYSTNGKDYKLAAVHSANSGKGLVGTGFAVPSSTFIGTLNKLKKTIK